MEYPALFESAPEGGFIVTFSDFPWGVTQGDTEIEASEMAADALVTMIREHIRNGEPVPSGSRPRGRKYRQVRLTALHSAKVELYQAFRQSGLRKADFARRLGLSKVDVERLFDLSHRSRLDLIEAALRMVGKQLTVQVSDAA